MANHSYLLTFAGDQHAGTLLIDLRQHAFSLFLPLSLQISTEKYQKRNEDISRCNRTTENTMIFQKYTTIESDYI